MNYETSEEVPQPMANGMRRCPSRRMRTSRSLLALAPWWDMEGNLTSACQLLSLCRNKDAVGMSDFAVLHEESIQRNWVCSWAAKAETQCQGASGQFAWGVRTVFSGPTFACAINAFDGDSFFLMFKVRGAHRGEVAQEKGWMTISRRQHWSWSVQGKLVDASKLDKACAMDVWGDVALGRTLGNSEVRLYFKPLLFQAKGTILYCAIMRG